MKKLTNLFVSSLTLLPAIALADHTTIGLQSSVTGPSTTSSANLMEAGQSGITLQFQQVDFKSISEADFAHASEHDEGLHGTDSINSRGFTFTYGLTERLTLGFSIADIRRSGLVEAAHHHEDEHEAELEEQFDGHHDEEEEEIIERLGSAGGIGDARLYANYQLFSSGSRSASMLFGIKAPTGESDEKSRDGHRLETEFQPGSDSWDPLLGIAFSQQFNNWTLNSNLLYSFTTEGAQDTDLGDVFNYNFALSHALPQFGPLEGSSWKVNFSLELNGEWRDKVEIAGATETNSGGSITYLAPGFSFNNDRIYINASVGKALENLNGIQSEPDTRFIVDFGWAL
ncbi:MAG: transporter [Gammaproteobacteria bacterium]|nr:transporter [Gammaproteobacteria bacterium]